MENPEKIEIEGLKTIHKLCKFGADHNMEGCTFTEIVERMFDELAKAQAIPDGCVVLKISDVREVLSNASDAMCDEVASIVFNETGSPSTWYDHHLIAEKNILDAIEAQEPTNDS